MSPNLQASASALNAMGVPLALLLLSTAVTGLKAHRAVRGSHQRWLWGGLYRAGLLCGVGANLSWIVTNLIEGDYGWVPVNVFFAWWWARAWRIWQRENDDDFWNSLGRKLKKAGRRVAGVFSGARPRPTPVKARAITTFLSSHLESKENPREHAVPDPLPR